MDALLTVFVYGTLKTGEPNNYWLTGESNGSAQLLSAGKTKECYPLVTATRYHIPFLLNLPGEGHQISGEIYAIDDTKLKHLDDLESYPQFYDRIVTEVSASDGSIVSCWIYVLKNYPADFLSNRKLLSSYKNTSDAPYVVKWDRVQAIQAIDDLDYRFT